MASSELPDVIGLEPLGYGTGSLSPLPSYDPSSSFSASSSDLVPFEGSSFNSSLQEYQNPNQVWSTVQSISSDVRATRQLLSSVIPMQAQQQQTSQEMVREMKRSNDLAERMLQNMSQGVKIKQMHKSDARTLRMVLSYFLRVGMDTRRVNAPFRGWHLVKISSNHDANEPSDTISSDDVSTDQVAIVLHISFLKMVYMLQSQFNIGVKLHWASFMKEFKQIFASEMEPLFQLITPEATQYWQHLFPLSINKDEFFVCRASRWITFLADEYQKMKNHTGLIQPDAKLSLPFVCHDSAPDQIKTTSSSWTVRQLAVGLAPYGLADLEKIIQMVSMPADRVTTFLTCDKQFFGVDDSMEYLQQPIVCTFYQEVRKALGLNSGLNHSSSSSSSAVGVMQHWVNLEPEDYAIHPVHPWSFLLFKRFGLPSSKPLDWLLADFPARLTPPDQWQDFYPPSETYHIRTFLDRLDHLQLAEARSKPSRKRRRKADHKDDEKQDQVQDQGQPAKKRAKRKHQESEPDDGKSHDKSSKSKPKKDQKNKKQNTEQYKEQYQEQYKKPEKSHKKQESTSESVVEPPTSVSDDDQSEDDDGDSSMAEEEH